MASRFVIILSFPLGFIPQIILWLFPDSKKIKMAELRVRDKYRVKNDKKSGGKKGKVNTWPAIVS